MATIKLKLKGTKKITKCANELAEALKEISVEVEDVEILDFAIAMVNKNLDKEVYVTRKDLKEWRQRNQKRSDGRQNKDSDIRRKDQAERTR